MKVRIRRDHGSLWLVVGPWAARLIYERDRGYGFAWLEGQGPIIRFMRRRWSGWHRWDEDWIP